MKRLVLALLLLPALAVAGQPLVCGVNSLTDRERGRRETLIEQLMPKAQVAETTDGYQLTWSGDPSTYGKVAEFVGLERRCCPFLDFSLQVSGPDAPVVLVLHGDDDTKQFVKDSGLLEGKP